MPPAVRLVQSAVAGSDIDRKIIALIAEHGSTATGLRLMSLGTLMHSTHGAKAGALGARNWRSYLEARPALYAVDPRGSEAMVRPVVKGFARTA